MAVFRDTCCPTKQATDVERRKVHGRLFAFSSAHNGAESLLTGQSSHAVASESVWQSGVRMLSSFGGPNRSHAAPPVMSINPDGTLAVVFQQGGRSMLQTARENLYDRCLFPPYGGQIHPILSHYSVFVFWLIFRRLTSLFWCQYYQKLTTAPIHFSLPATKPLLPPF